MEKQLPREALVVEDEPMTRMVAADAISEVGVKVLEASDAGEALRILGDHPKVSLLFTDIELPGGMDGRALAEEVHGARPDVTSSHKLMLSAVMQTKHLPRSREVLQSMTRG